MAIAERAYQQARAYARERVQGQVPGMPGRVTIIHHADVRRMLLTMKAQIEAMRSAAYVTAADLDLAHHAADPATLEAGCPAFALPRSVVNPGTGGIFPGQQLPVLPQGPLKPPAPAAAGLPGGALPIGPDGAPVAPTGAPPPAGTTAPPAGAP